MITLVLRRAAARRGRGRRRIPLDVFRYCRAKLDVSACAAVCCPSVFGSGIASRASLWVTCATIHGASVLDNGYRWTERPVITFALITPNLSSPRYIEGLHGVGVGTLYRHLRQRFDLVKAVLEQTTVLLSAQVTR